AAPVVRGVLARGWAAARRRARAARLERVARGRARGAAGAAALDRARAGGDRAGAPARAAHVAVGLRQRPSRAAAGLRAAGRAAGAAAGAGDGARGVVGLPSQRDAVAGTGGRERAGRGGTWFIR